MSKKVSLDEQLQKIKKPIESEKKICFVVMPISDQDGYEKGHFKRVYEHLIKPAVEVAGFKAVRADDEYKTNNIILDIIRKIIESDHVICDLSARNANVFYELGIRQAFDKSITLIKDNKTPRVFDVSGIRTIDYDDNLRIDNIQNKITEIAQSIKETVSHQDSDSLENSIIKQLAIKAAQPAPNTEVSLDTKIILEYLNNIAGPLRTNSSLTPSRVYINNSMFEIGHIFLHGEKILGEILSIDFNNKSIIIDEAPNSTVSSIIKIPFDRINEDPLFSSIDDVPF